jgi:hypothetical protein
VSSEEGFAIAATECRNLAGSRPFVFIWKTDDCGFSGSDFFAAAGAKLATISFKLDGEAATMRAVNCCAALASEKTR